MTVQLRAAVTEWRQAILLARQVASSSVTPAQIENVRHAIVEARRHLFDGFHHALAFTLELVLERLLHHGEAVADLRHRVDDIELRLASAAEQRGANSIH